LPSLGSASGHEDGHGLICFELESMKDVKGMKIENDCYSHGRFGKKTRVMY